MADGTILCLPGAVTAIELPSASQRVSELGPTGGCKLTEEFMDDLMFARLIVGLFISVLPALIVYMDARNLEKKGYAISASKWALGVFITTTICLPLYLSDRSRLLRQGLTPQ